MRQALVGIGQFAHLNLHGHWDYVASLLFSAVRLMPYLQNTIPLSCGLARHHNIVNLIAILYRARCISALERQGECKGHTTLAMLTCINDLM